MDKLNELKKKYNDLMIQAWNENKDILIESFVEYYGEECRDLIVSRINEIEFIYYAPIPQLDFLDSLMVNVDDNLKKDYIEYRDAFYESQNNKNIPNNLIGMITSNVDNIIDIDKVTSRLACSYFASEPFSKSTRFVCLPIFIIGNKSIIHEINHAITYQPLMVISDENKGTTDVTKHGIDTDNVLYHENSFTSLSGDEILVEELLNEKSALEITEIFDRRGGNLLYFNTIQLQSSYTDNLYLINDFYYHFKDLLKESRITINKNRLIETVGKDNYNKFISAVNQYYSGGTTIEEQQKLLQENKKHYSEILNIVSCMNDYRQQCVSLTSDELTSYYQELEQQGYTVTPLNEDKKTK